MKRRFCALILLALLVTFLPASGAPFGDGSRPNANSAKGVELSVKVSDDGKTLTADDDNDWQVINPDLLKGVEGRYITVRCRMDLDKRSIRVLSVEQPSEHFRGAHLGDAAFRR